MIILSAPNLWKRTDSTESGMHGGIELWICRRYSYCAIESFLTRMANLFVTSNINIPDINTMDKNQNPASHSTRGDTVATAPLSLF